MPRVRRGSDAKADACLKESRSLNPDPRAVVMEVQRLFQPDDAALDVLVDALYTLLMDVPVGQSEVRPDPPEPTCVSGPPE